MAETTNKARGEGKTLGMSAVVESVKAARDRYEDNTDWIRHAKNADRYRRDVNAILAILARRTTAANCALLLDSGSGLPAHLTPLGDEEMNEVFVECKAAAPSLFLEMQVVFTKLLTNQLDIPVFFKLLDTLESIERGEMDQEAGSEAVGQLLYRSFGNGPAASSAAPSSSTKDADDAAAAAAATAPSSSGATTTDAAPAVAANPTLTWKEYAAAKNIEVMTKVHRHQTVLERAKETNTKLQTALARAKAKSGRR